MKENNNSVENLPVALIDDNLIEIANMAEKRIEAIKKIKSIVFRVTNSRDWIDQGGNPYLQASGGEKVGGVFGISWRIDEPQLTTEESGHYSYTYKGYFSMGGRIIEVIGSRGTIDPFFSKSHGEAIPPSEIDRNDVKKAALTNLIGNGVTRILGIRNLTWEELEAAGIKRDKTVKVDYGKAEMTSEAKDLRDKIGSMLMEMAGSNKAAASKLLTKYTSFVGKDGKEVKGKSSLAGLSEKAIPVTYGKVKEAYEEWKKDKKDAEDIEKKFEENEKKIKKGEGRDEPGEGKLL